VVRTARGDNTVWLGRAGRSGGAGVAGERRGSERHGTKGSTARGVVPHRETHGRLVSTGIHGSKAGLRKRLVDDQKDPRNVQEAGATRLPGSPRSR